MTIEYGKKHVLKQREKGRPGFMIGGNISKKYNERNTAEKQNISNTSCSKIESIQSNTSPQNH